MQIHKKSGLINFAVHKTMFMFSELAFCLKKSLSFFSSSNYGLFYRRGNFSFVRGTNHEGVVVVFIGMSF